MWLIEGDRNSKYFHVAAKTRRKVNHINSLQNNEGQTVEWETGLQETMVDYFTELNYMSTKITEEQNEELLMPIEDEEVKRALFHMHPDKSPGPNGMSPAFYQKFWSIVGGDIIQLVRNFFLNCSFDEHLTDTNIVLIPKKKCAIFMTDLRPISLCNVVYKIASKVLANRLKCVIHKAISETQRAFIPGRLITCNIMISYEVMHYMKRKTQGKT